MKEKILAIVDDIKAAVTAIYKERFWIDWYGAYDINPRHLVIWVCVQSDHHKQQLGSNAHLMYQLRQILVNHDYPEPARPFVHIGFESEETVRRESDGNWYYHFK